MLCTISQKQTIFNNGSANNLSDNKNQNQESGKKSLILVEEGQNSKLPIIKEEPILETEEIYRKSLVEEVKDRKEMLAQELLDLKKKFEKMKKENKNTAHHNEIHKYNETKDTAQYLLGYIANFKNKQVKVLYEEFGISDDEC
jgi:hypothetical protein